MSQTPPDSSSSTDTDFSTVSSPEATMHPHSDLANIDVSNIPSEATMASNPDSLPDMCYLDSAPQRTSDSQFASSENTRDPQEEIASNPASAFLHKCSPLEDHDPSKSVNAHTSTPPLSPTPTKAHPTPPPLNHHLSITLIPFLLLWVTYLHPFVGLLFAIGFNLTSVLILIASNLLDIANTFIDTSFFDKEFGNILRQAYASYLVYMYLFGQGVRVTKLPEIRLEGKEDTIGDGRVQGLANAGGAAGEGVRGNWRVGFVVKLGEKGRLEKWYEIGSYRWKKEV